MSTMSVTRGRSVDKRRATKSRAPAQCAQRGGLARVARAVVRVSQHALEAWCGREAELRDSGALTDERVSAIASLAMSREQPFGS